MTSEHEIPLGAAVALSAHLLDGGKLDDVLLRVCAATVEHLAGADEASVTLLTGNKATTYGATSGLPEAADERQYEADAGPCLDAARANQPVIVDDARTDKRWPDVLAHIADEGVLSSMSIPLPVQGTAIGALNIYSRAQRSFNEASIGVGQQLASFAAVAVANAVSYAKVAEQAENMQLAMASRAVIEQAKGVVMARVGCDADAAFRLLVEQSQHENRKLREVAVELVHRAASNGVAH